MHCIHDKSSLWNVVLSYSEHRAAVLLGGLDRLLPTEITNNEFYKTMIYTIDDY